MHSRQRSDTLRSLRQTPFVIASSYSYASDSSGHYVSGQGNSLGQSESSPDPISFSEDSDDPSSYSRSSTDCNMEQVDSIRQPSGRSHRTHGPAFVTSSRPSNASVRYRSHVLSAEVSYMEKHQQRHGDLYTNIQASRLSNGSSHASVENGRCAAVAGSGFLATGNYPVGLPYTSFLIPSPGGIIMPSSSNVWQLQLENQQLQQELELTRRELRAMTRAYEGLLPRVNPSSGSGTSGVVQSTPSDRTTAVPNPGSRLPPVPAVQRLHRQHYLDTNFWERAFWTEHVKKVSTEMDTQTSSGMPARGSTLIAQGVNKNHKYLETADGQPVDGFRLSSMLQKSRAIFSLLWDYGVAPTSWHKAPLDVQEFYYAHMACSFIEFALCSNNWKANHFATLQYSGWHKAKLSEKVGDGVGERCFMTPSVKEETPSPDILLGNTSQPSSGSTGDSEMGLLMPPVPNLGTSGLKRAAPTDLGSDLFSESFGAPAVKIRRMQVIQRPRLQTTRILSFVTTSSAPHTPSPLRNNEITSNEMTGACENSKSLCNQLNASGPAIPAPSSMVDMSVVAVSKPTVPLVSKGSEPGCAPTTMSDMSSAGRTEAHSSDSGMADTMGALDDIKMAVDTGALQPGSQKSAVGDELDDKPPPLESLKTEVVLDGSLHDASARHCLQPPQPQAVALSAASADSNITSTSATGIVAVPTPGVPVATSVHAKPTSKKMKLSVRARALCKSDFATRNPSIRAKGRSSLADEFRMYLENSVLVSAAAVQLWETRAANAEIARTQAANQVQDHISAANMIPSNDGATLN
ncbi:hypothetical protein FISHEDRAFT_69769 [Fistulina hepatica ATCC 64428]|uniref:Uncharacterized protein n=1 Tax=Fistulina hepatica ATCC 64428 TaxID=1128425 RepID=A0A0D7ALB0_9AGAR|nr:hypothetical protein FISHEDRAFT_69769 [Fistulina hepatica ATCC 64428]